MTAHAQGPGDGEVIKGERNEDCDRVLAGLIADGGKSSDEHGAGPAQLDLNCWQRSVEEAEADGVLERREQKDAGPAWLGSTKSAWDRAVASVGRSPAVATLGDGQPAPSLRVAPSPQRARTPIRVAAVRTGIRAAREDPDDWSRLLYGQVHLAYCHWAVADPTAASWHEAVRTEAGPIGWCWDNAWRLAMADGLDYAEGIVLRDGPAGAEPEIHAWCLDGRGRVVEATEGYGRPEDQYRGWRLRNPQGDGLALRAVWEDAYDADDGADDGADPNAAVLVQRLRRLVAARWW